MRDKAKSGGFALLDVVLAVAIFAISVTGLIQILQQMNETSASFAKERVIQARLEAVRSQTKRRDLSSMTSETYDPDFDLTFRTYAEPFQIDNGEGAELADLYELTAEVEYVDEGGSQLERVSLIVHLPR